MYQIIWNFFIYAFLGWCTEVSYAALVSRKFVNRGFLNGPVCPIYGVGAIIVLSCLDPLKDNLLLLFAGSVLLTSLLELVTGFVLEKLFHQRWWDYSEFSFNIGGYICLLFSILWGIGCLFVVKLLHPAILFLVHLIPHTLGLVLLSVFGLVMAVDVAATVKTIIGFNRRLTQIDELAAKIRSASDEFGENLADHVLDAAEMGADLREDLWEWRDDLNRKAAAAAAERSQHHAVKRAELEEFRSSMQELLEARGFGQRRLLNAFPKMRSTNHGKALERMRRRMERR